MTFAVHQKLLSEWSYLSKMSYRKLSCFFCLSVCLRKVGWPMTHIYLETDLEWRKHLPNTQLFFLTFSRAAGKPEEKHP